VHVPAARGSVIPEMDSIRDDFPALWIPITAIWGRSISIWTLNVPVMSACKERKTSRRTRCYASG
jgi:hypothetical protein